MTRALRPVLVLAWLLATLAVGGCGSSTTGPATTPADDLAPAGEEPADDAAEAEPPLDDPGAPPEVAPAELPADELPATDTTADKAASPEVPTSDLSWFIDVPLSDPAPTDVAPTDPGGPPGATAAQVAALQAINAYRATAGVAAVHEVQPLNNSAQAHADYVVANCASYKATGLSPHEENPSWPGYTGTVFTDRMTHFGYSWWGASEVIAFQDNPSAAVAQWVESVYHRLPLLDPATLDIGYGGAGPGSCSGSQFARVDVVDIGLSTSGTAAGPSIYPPAGATGMPCSFDGLESPLPPTPPTGYPSGPIVTVQYGFAAATPQVTGHAFGVEGGAALDHFLLAKAADAAHGVTGDKSMFDGALALYAYKPLAAKTTYRVTLDLKQSGQAVKLDWTFTTGACQ